MARLAHIPDSTEGKILLLFGGSPATASEIASRFVDFFWFADFEDIRSDLFLLEHTGRLVRIAEDCWCPVGGLNNVKASSCENEL